jgi:hypothetical protein
MNLFSFAELFRVQDLTHEFAEIIDSEINSE